MADTCVEIAPKPEEAREVPFGSKFIEKLLENLYDGVYFVDSHRRILYWNKGAERLSGHCASELLGRFCYDNILDHVDERGCHLCMSGCPLTAAVLERKASNIRVYLKHRDGRRIPVDVLAMPAIGADGSILGAVEIFRDASSAVAQETMLEDLRQQAEHDPLTRLVNRRHLDRMLDLHYEVLRRTSLSFSVILADIDHFKWINDTWGHPVGDKALVAFAEKTRGICRVTDVLGRFGGEEFLAILPDTDLSIAVTIAERMRAAVPEASPVEFGDRRMTASFGVAQAFQGETIERVMEKVDSALYRAKEGGRNRVES